MELIDGPRPEPIPDEVLVEVDYAGMCGSDAGIYEFEAAFGRMDLPTVIGHEYSGRVVEVGDAVGKFAIGDRVVERPIRGCGDCYQCVRGEENVCQNSAITGVDHDGAYEPYLAVPEAALHRVPDDVEQQHTPPWSNRRASRRAPSSRTPASAPATASWSKGPARSAS